MAAQAMSISCSCNCNALTSSTSTQKKSRSEFFSGSQNARLSSFSNSSNARNVARESGPMAVEAAISRDRKEATIAKAREQLEGACLVAAIAYSGFTVKQFQKLRKELPETSTLLVAKNTLIGKAIEGTKWEALKPALKGMNAWLFVHSEEIPAAIKPYRNLQKEFKLENDFTGAVFEGKFYAPGEFKELESMPTRAELFSKLLGSIQTPATNLVGTLQGPGRELVLTLKAYVAKLEEAESS